MSFIPIMHSFLILRTLKWSCDSADAVMFKRQRTQNLQSFRTYLSTTDDDRNDILASAFDPEHQIWAWTWASSTKLWICCHPLWRPFQAEVSGLMFQVIVQTLTQPLSDLHCFYSSNNAFTLKKTHTHNTIQERRPLCFGRIRVREIKKRGLLTSRMTLETLCLRLILHFSFRAN